MTNEINRMTEVKISEVLHLAADEHLAISEEEWCNGKFKYSCDAVGQACAKLSKSIIGEIDLKMTVNEGLRNMGVITSSTCEFSEFECNLQYDNTFISEQAQGARYTWLKFAAMIAEEQGV